MKYSIPSLIAIVAAFALFSTQADAGNVYQASMTGCTSCNNCKKKVVMSFAAIEGVQSVRFLNSKKGDLFQVVIETADNFTLTPQRAAAALKDFPDYELRGWQQIASGR